MSRLQFTRQQSAASAPIFVPNGSFSGRRSSPGLKHESIGGRLESNATADSGISDEMLSVGTREIGIAESFFGRQMTQHSGGRELDLIRSKSPVTMIRSISSSDGRSMKFVSEVNGLGPDHSSSYSRRWHRHARDVSLAAPGNRPHWHLAKTNPSSSATPPSQFLRYHGSDAVYSGHNDFPSPLDAHSPANSGRYFHQVLTSSQRHSEATSSPENSNSDSLNYHAVSPHNSSDALSKQSSNFNATSPNHVTTDCFNTMQEIDDFFPEDLTPTRPSVISNTAFIQTTSTIGNPTRKTSICIQEEDYNGLEPTQPCQSRPFVQTGNPYRCHSEPNTLSPFVKFERDIAYNGGSSSEAFIKEEQIFHSQKNSLYSGTSSNVHLQRHDEIQSMFPLHSNEPNVQGSPTLELDEKQREEGSCMSVSEIFVRLNGGENQDRPDEHITAHNINMQPDQNQIVIENMFVSLSDQRRTSLPGTDELLFTSTANGLPERSNTPNFPCSAPQPMDGRRKRAYFQTAMREVLNEVDKEKRGGLRDGDAVENSYESMKNFWSNAKPNTINQMYACATGDFKSLGQVITM